ncbi:MAG TPA: hypothetical protein VFE51_31015, partial [Verrucomicrobiae bacterium]|nr:hypothetical protein [Verrucomicrobiae bacterium]
MMRRRIFLKQLGLSAGTALVCPPITMVWAAAERPGGQPNQSIQSDPALREDWLARWEKNIEADSHNRYCDKETGEELGWLVSPFLNGFYYGFLAT